jgi:intermembrane space import and assembly protein 40
MTSTAKSQLKPNATSPPPLAPTSVTEVDVFIPDAPSDPVVVTETTISSEPPSEAATEASTETGTEAEYSGANTGAYNPETGEINWDCPCLGGMAHGPCGPEFREAFSCFIYSEEEPKGINCVEKFQNMQNCFRAHPDVYADGMCTDALFYDHVC